ncbi:MAG: ribose 5-phosphate isomerase B [Proteobacteria bacterium]|nr:ribose 5-phosphate isomerase B [Pseudomonadota bacterium]MDA1181684.1 ribose 5-phosphate isomerase B [Pseudomonadota bacterium]
MNKKIFIASDHAGYEMKTKLKDNFSSFIDLGTNSIDSVDYPDFAKKLTNEVLNNDKSLGILICGTGVGMSIAANRSKGIRAGLVNSVEVARLIRQHNDANVLVIPGRFMEAEEAINCVKMFIETQFEAGRHKQRIEKI